jgi:hypothetical protein
MPRCGVIRVRSSRLKPSNLVKSKKFDHSWPRSATLCAPVGICFTRVAARGFGNGKAAAAISMNAMEQMSVLEVTGDTLRSYELRR